MASPVTVGFEITGWYAENLKRKINRQVAALLNDGNKHGVKVMQANAPVRTGAMRDDLQVLKEATEDDLSVQAGSTTAVHYTLFQEFGWQGHPGKHFIRKGFQESLAYVKSNMKRVKI